MVTISKSYLQFSEVYTIKGQPCNSSEKCHLFRKTLQQQKQGPQQDDMELDYQMQGTCKAFKQDVTAI